MAENVFDIGVGTGVDTSGLKKGLDEAQKEILDQAAKLTQETEKAAQDQIDKIKETEKQKIEEIKKTIEEQIRLEKEKPGLDPSILQAEINAIKQAGNAKIKETQTSSQLEQQIIKNAANTKIKILQDYAKKQVSTLKSGNLKSLQSIKDFTKGAVGQLMGLDQVLSSLAGGPVALGKLFVDLGKKAVAALNEAADAWRKQEQAEVALRNAARNNPYLNDTAVKQLNQFASEMQRLTGLDSVMITQTQTRLASLGRNQQQIKDILKVAADMAASGVMDFDSAVNELNNSLNGMVRTSGRLYPELKNLSKEALASGQAIEIIGQKVAGSAAEAMKTGEGSITAYKNAVGDLKKIIGEGWEQATKGFRIALTNYINSVVDARNKTKELKAAVDAIKAGSRDTTDYLTVEGNKLKELNEQLGIYQRLLDGTITRADAEYARLHHMSSRNAEEQIKALSNEIIQQEKIVTGLKSRINIEESIAAAIERARAAAVRAGEDNLTAINAVNKALEAQLSARRLLDMGQAAGAQTAMREAEAAAKAAEAEAARVEKAEKDRHKINDLMDDYRNKLKEQTDWIIKQAELRGEDKNSLEVQKQILDTQISAYKSLIDASGGLIKNELTIEQAIKRASGAYTDRANKEKDDEEARKKADEERKKRLADLTKLQEEAAQKLAKLNEDLIGEARLQGEERLQKQIAALKEKNLFDGIEREAMFERVKAQEIAHEKKQAADKAKEDQLKALDELNKAAIEDAKGNQKEINRIKAEGTAERARIEEEHAAAMEQLTQNANNRMEEIEKARIASIEQAYITMYEKILSESQKYVNAVSSIANSISTIWTNNIDFETNEKLKANDKLIQSDEERAAAEKKIQMEAANERYKAELFAWTANVNMAMAQTAMAMLNAYTEGLKGGGMMAPVIGAMQMALAGAIGAMQVAAVISARPKPPRFHSGGVVEGHGEQSAILKGGEVVQTQKQFQNTMQAISNLADTKTGAGVQMNVKIENNASNKVSAEPQITADGFKVVIKEIVNQGFNDGSFDSGIAVQQTNLQGGRLL